MIPKETPPLFKDPACGDAELAPLSKLWRAMLAQTIRDLTATKESTRLEAALWITGQNPAPDPLDPLSLYDPIVWEISFEDACDLSGFDSDWLRNEITEAMGKSEPYRSHTLIRLSQRVNSSILMGL